MTEQPQTLQEVAAAREEWRAAVERARARYEELRIPFDEAGRVLTNAQRELAKTELALATAKRAHFIAQAVAEVGVETSEPPVLLAQGYRLPDVYELAALAPDGTGLYVHRETGRRGRTTGKTNAVRVDAVPEAIRELITFRVPVGDGRAERAAVNERIREAGLPVDAWINSGPVHGSDVLFRWQARGKGDFGEGSGSMKPLPPPGGGRWRWLKVREQEELGVAP